MEEIHIHCRWRLLYQVYVGCRGGSRMIVWRHIVRYPLSFRQIQRSMFRIPCKDDIIAMAMDNATQSYRMWSWMAEIWFPVAAEKWASSFWARRPRSVGSSAQCNFQGNVFSNAIFLGGVPSLTGYWTAT